MYICLFFCSHAILTVCFRVGSDRARVRGVRHHLLAAGAAHGPAGRHRPSANRPHVSRLHTWRRRSASTLYYGCVLVKGSEYLTCACPLPLQLSVTDTSLCWQRLGRPSFLLRECGSKMTAVIRFL